MRGSIEGVGSQGGGGLWSRWGGGGNRKGVGWALVGWGGGLQDGGMVYEAGGGGVSMFRVELFLGTTKR